MVFFSLRETLRALAEKHNTIREITRGIHPDDYHEVYFVLISEPDKDLQDEIRALNIPLSCLDEKREIIIWPYFPNLQEKLPFTGDAV